jgi:hypothetical protein
MTIDFPTTALVIVDMQYGDALETMRSRGARVVCTEAMMEG